MNNNPIDIRRALQRFPRWTQAVWTAITGLASPGEVARPRRAWMHIATQLCVYVLAMALGVSAMQSLLMPMLA